MPQGSQHDGASARPRAFSATRTPSRSFSRASPCRADGEEFVVIAPEVGDDAALAAGAERLRRLFADEPLEAGAHRLPVTVSIGAALLETGGNALETVEHAGRLAKSAKQWRNTALVQTAPPQEAAAG